MENITGASCGPGSLKPSPDGLGPAGFDPSRIASYDETDWHVLAQDIANYWQHPEERAVAYQAAAEAIKLLRLELDRRDRNEQRNCLNWGPCSLNDGRMSEGIEKCAQGIETRSAKTEGLGPQDESPVTKSCAQGPAA